MSNLSVYNNENFIADQMNLSLCEAGEKYTHWQDHEFGAVNFARMTVIIAMREFLIDELSVKPETLTSSEQVTKQFYDLREEDPFSDTEQPAWEYDPSQRDLYLLRALKSTVFRHTIKSHLREFAVKHHACGLKTADIISLLFSAPEHSHLTPLRHYVDHFPVMKQSCRDYLSTQLNYLKRGHPRFPKKYSQLWQTARTEHLQELQHLPLTHIHEQVAALQEHYLKLRQAYDQLPEHPEYTRDRERLTNAMNRTMSGIYQMTRDPAYPKPHTLESKSAGEIPKNIDAK